MTPYLAVIKDSFREALSSRVLWILLVLITLFLILLAPLAWHWQLSTGVAHGDLRDLPRFVEDASRAKSGTPAEYVWNILDLDLRKRLVKVDPEDYGEQWGLSHELIPKLDAAVKRSDFFVSEKWDGSLSDKGEELAKKKRLTKNEQLHLNRLALEAAFPGRFRSHGDQAVLFKYLHWELGQAPLTEDVMNELVQGTFGTFMDYVVGVLGIFVGILVTASIIPNMFDPGSINLLLSKPISRSMLFLSKFVGGCSFVLINASFLLIGLWLLAGLRWGIWQHNLLICIPIFMFVFSVYYAVSTFTGVVWRNAIVSIACTILFWGMCFSVGLVRDLMQQFVIEPTRITKVIDAGDAMMAVNNTGSTIRWQESTNQWEPLDSQAMPAAAWMAMQPVAGPIYDSEQERIVIAQRGFPYPKLFVAKKDTGWTRNEVGGCPVGLKSLFVDNDNEIIAVATTGVYRLRSEPPKKIPSLRLPGMDIPLHRIFGTDSGPFENIGPEDFSTSEQMVAAFDKVDGELVVFDQGEFLRYRRESVGEGEDSKQKYVLVGDKISIEQQNQQNKLAVAGNTVLIAKGDGAIEVRAKETMKLKSSFTPFGKNQAHSISSSRDGRWFVVVYHVHKAVLYDAEEDKLIASGPIGKPDISGAGFIGDGNLAIADRADRIRVYSMSDWKEVDNKTAEMTIAQKIFRWAIVPIYTVFPKPGKLNETRAYLLTQKETVITEVNDPSMSKVQPKLDPWTPVWSSGLFVVVMLLLSCWYVGRREF